MVESASIDKQSHLRRPCGSIGELKQLDDTLKMVLDYARAHPETLVLVTADESRRGMESQEAAGGVAGEARTLKECWRLDGTRRDDHHRRLDDDLARDVPRR